MRKQSKGRRKVLPNTNILRIITTISFHSTSYKSLSSEPILDYLSENSSSSSLSINSYSKSSSSFTSLTRALTNVGSTSSRTRETFCIACPTYMKRFFNIIFLRQWFIIIFFFIWKIKIDARLCFDNYFPLCS